MTFRAVTLLAICLLLVDIHAPPMHAQDARSDAVVWTGIIPEGPGSTLRMHPQPSDHPSHLNRRSLVSPRRQII